MWQIDCFQNFQSITTKHSFEHRFRLLCTVFPLQTALACFALNRGEEHSAHTIRQSSINQNQNV